MLGGIRSGKSGYAERLVTDRPRVTYVATAADRPGDPEWQARLDAHRRRRPGGWRTHESAAAPESLPQLVRDAGADETLLVDDLGGWITALYDAAGWQGRPADAATDALVAALAGTAATVVLVSPEVGLSVVGDNAAARAFADALGRLNQRVADRCDRVALLVAGQPLWIKPGAGSNLTP